MLNEYDLHRWINSYWLYLITTRKGVLGRPSINDLKEDARIIGRMHKVAGINSNHRVLLLNEYDVSVDIVDCWEHCTKNHGVNFIFLTETKIISYIINYAKVQKQRFENIIREEKVQKSENNSISLDKDRQINISFDNLTNDPERKNLLLKAMLDLSIVNNKGECMLLDRQKGKLAGFIDALIEYEIIPDHPKTILDDIFCLRMGLKSTRLKRESKQYYIMKGKAGKYLNKKLQGH